MNAYARAIELARTKVADAASKFLPDLCTIYGPGTEVADEYGDLTTADSIIAEDVPCSYGALFGYERSGLGVQSSIAVHYVTVPATYQVHANYKIVVTERGEQPEKTFQVIAPLQNSNELLLKVAATLKD